MARNQILSTFVYCAICSLACTALQASEHHGIVKFGGLGVPGATVTATQGDKSVVAVTDPQGVYTFADLADGVWNLKVEMLCFTTMTKEVAIAPDAPSPEWDLKLLPFDEIKASAPPPVAAPPTAAAAPPAAVPAQSQPDKAAPPAIPKAGKKASKAAANGAAAGNGFQRADLNASSAPPAEEPAGGGVDEANAAGASDALLVNGSTSNGVERRAIGNFRKGPGSGYRGDVSSIVDNSALDARVFSITGQDTPKAAFNHMRYGVTFGGPLTIPHLFRTNNGNFFVAYQGSRNRNANNPQPSLMPTDLERSGQLNGPAIDPSNGAPFPDNKIPAERIQPQATALLKFYPEPNFDPLARYNYQIPLIGTSDSDAVQSRVNKMLNPRNTLNGGLGYQRTTADNPNVFHFVDTNGTSGINLNLSWRHTFTKTLYGTLGGQYSRYSVRNTSPFANGVDVAGDAGIGGTDREPRYFGPPNLSFSSGYAGLSDGPANFIRNQTSAVSYQVLWLKRPHNITMGGDVRRIQLNVLGQQDPRGSFGFTGAATGNDFADFLLGIPDTASIAYGNADKYFRSTSYDAYFTDDWRVSAGFTLNAGARWEYWSPITEKYGRLGNLDVAGFFGATQPVYGNTPTGPLTGRQYPDSLVRSDKHGIQPRIGLSWRPIFGSSLLIRAGYGVTYNTSVYNAIAQQMAQQSRFSINLNAQNTKEHPLDLAGGLITTTGIKTFAIDPDFLVGYAQNWQASAQVDLPAAMVMTATYNGIKGTRGVQAFLPNTYPDGVANPCAACVAGYTYLASNGNSTRQSGQLQLRRRLHNGVTATAQYTYSHSFDDAALGGRGQSSSVIAQNWLDLSGERGPSNFDQRHLFSLTTQYSTGVGVHGGALLRGWKGEAFKGWTLTTQINAGSGLPETPTYGVAVAGTGVIGPIRPDATGQSVYAAPPGRHLNPAAFAPPQPGQWGTAGRNSIVGPGTFTLNASLSRTFADNLDLRFDSTNTLNHVTYPSWNTAVISGQFGLPVTANAMRSLQATLRWRF